MKTLFQLALGSLLLLASMVNNTWANDSSTPQAIQVNASVHRTAPQLATQQPAIAPLAWQRVGSPLRMDA